MNKVISGFLFFAIAATMHADDKKAPFKLSVVPTASGTNQGVISVAKKEPQVFYVVLTNISDQPQPTWETWNSWGFWTISFDLTMPNGKHFLITKNRREGFTVNFPSMFFVAPGEHQVYPIHLDAEWDNRPAFAENGETRVILKAIYEVSPTKESAKYGVWTGRIESTGYELILNHW
jgi:hypothetical protein